VNGTKQRVALYTRISTDEANQPYSLGAQRDRMEAYVAAQPGWQVVAHYEDLASGKSLERPALATARRAAQAGEYDLLLVFRVDRLSRNLGQLAALMEELEGARVAFRSLTEPFDTTNPAGRIMLQMLGVFAEFERASIIERIGAGMERKAHRGEWTVGSYPYGYHRGPDGPGLMPDPAAAPGRARCLRPLRHSPPKQRRHRGLAQRTRPAHHARRPLDARLGAHAAHQPGVPRRGAIPRQLACRAAPSAG
jgi:site-specific DNA recombinase